MIDLYLEGPHLVVLNLCLKLQFLNLIFQFFDLSILILGEGHVFLKLVVPFLKFFAESVLSQRVLLSDSKSIGK